MNNKYEKLQIHFFYCILLLLLSIILIATDRWTVQKDFTAYLSNAATMTSLVLGLIAIFYSFIANDGLSKSLGNISSVADEVAQSRDQIAQFVTFTRSSADAAGEGARAMNEISMGVTSTLSSLQNTLEIIKTQTEALNLNVIGLPVKFDQLETKVIAATRVLSEQKPGSEQTPADGQFTHLNAEVVRHFLAISAVVYNMLTYAVVLADEKKKPLHLDAFCAAVNVSIPHLFSGFLACLRSIEMVTYSFDGGDYSNYVIESIDPTLKSTMRPYLDKYIDVTLADDLDKQLEVRTLRRNVERLFE